MNIHIFLYSVMLFHLFPLFSLSFNFIPSPRFLYSSIPSIPSFFTSLTYSFLRSFFSIYFLYFFILWTFFLLLHSFILHSSLFYNSLFHSHILFFVHFSIYFFYLFIRLTLFLLLLLPSNLFLYSFIRYNFLYEIILVLQINCAGYSVSSWVKTKDWRFFYHVWLFNLSSWKETRYWLDVCQYIIKWCIIDQRGDNYVIVCFQQGRYCFRVDNSVKTIDLVVSIQITIPLS